ncbi:hypothetical protein [Natronorubrum bangense]|uniref:Uncharacterized protein n=2 Tax=Natronorubrum bangense TaxID=61858 RepID=L9WPS0_9EURY|nr:hypothetical protein [Natronorubrum bangense]ELY51387.1 hypothetical protein C494_03545 [Natronorubrum bangense JCM 10635]QCC54641.1 hypothetical protein DV706_09275 [Natronorubrum bangense]
MTACVTGVAGCIGESDKDLYFHEGDPFIRFEGMGDFSGAVRIVPSCRDETVEISITDGQPNGSIPYTREELGEECSFEIFVDGEHANTANVSGTQQAEINMDESGEIFITDIQI